MLQPAGLIDKAARMKPAGPPPLILKRAGQLALTLAFAVGIVSLYALTAGRLYDHDCFGYGEVAQGILDGKVLYRDIWMNKPILAIAFYAVPQLFARGSYLGVQTFLGFWVVLQALCVLWLPRRVGLGQRWAGALLIALLPLTRPDFTWASTEHIGNLFAVVTLFIAYNFATEKRFTLAECVAVGVVTACTFHTRQPTALLGGVPGLMLLLTQEPIRRKCVGTLCMAAGFLGVFGALTAAVALLGDLRIYFHVVFISSRQYAEAGGLRNLVWLLDLFRNQSFALLVFILFALAMSTDRKILVLSSLAVSVFVAVAPLKVHQHYWAGLIPVCGLMLVTWLAADRTATAPVMKWAFSLGILLFTALSAVWGVAAVVHAPNIQQWHRVAEEVDRLSGPHDTLFVAGKEGAYIYFASRTPPANAYFWDLYLDRYWSKTLSVKVDKVLENYRATPPTVIAIEERVLGDVKSGRFQPASEVDPGPNVHELISWLLEHVGYEESSRLNGWAILRKRAP
jgi:hypothetical protein